MSTLFAVGLALVVLLALAFGVLVAACLFAVWLAGQMDEDK